MTERTERDERLLKIYQYAFSVINLQSYLIKTLADIINFTNGKVSEINDQFGKDFMKETVDYLSKEFDWDIHMNKDKE